MINEDKPDFEEAIEYADDLLNDLDELPDKAEEFQESVRHKVNSMRLWMMETESVTPKMITALQNMRDGVNKWLERENDDE